MIREADIAYLAPGRNSPRCRTPQELDQLAAYFNASHRLNSGHLIAYAPLQKKRTEQMGLVL